MNQPARDMLIKAGFINQVKRYENGDCTECGKPTTWDTLRNKDAKTLFRKVGLCQKCQDDIFGNEIERRGFDTN